ncbi:uncharacterized protein EKO05_0010595 [Ascochyta rabiei]|uniref:Uncharacterized protein n=1 Tax=Didymella rabiei TaxID=5454 RepID=A0A163J448_DIDRA|nr:uncharacterized protein EKO05_0010595 [Ascochyta rabiei]KZM26134.1 hypothetical protein ST47_g2729 [Ascochyta rabiei]UPX20361.1 hypothetical protein EKO05_0010595 [Ascochyta rabiei]
MEVTDATDVLYHGWDLEVMRDAGDVASCAQISSSIGFTAINQGHLQRVSIPQSATIAQPQQDQEVRTTSGSNQRRNPTVASYLGLGDLAEPTHLAAYALNSSGHLPQPLRKRRAQQDGEKTHARKRTNTDGRKAPRQKRVSESLCVIEHSTQSITYKLDGSTENNLSTPGSIAILEATTPAIEPSQTARQGQLFDSITVNTSHAPPDETSCVLPIVSTDEDVEFDQLCFDFETSHHPTDNSAHPLSKSKPTQRANLRLNNDNDFDDDDLMDDDLIDFTMNAVVDSSSLELQSDSSTKIDIVNERVLETQTSGTSADDTAVLHEEVVSSQRKFVSPVTLTTRLLAAASNGARKPMVRPAFPAAVRDRSPIIGLSSETVLKTCFRVGEAINQSCQANKNGNNILIELYTRVLHSERDDLQQRFTFCDLFHAKPPYIQGVYAAAIWKSVQLFEYDSARLLQQGRICRCMGMLKRDGKNWIMTVLNVWEATWDDVQWVRGIVSL